MTFTSSAATGRRAAMARSGRLQHILFLLLALIASGWSTLASAQSCDFVPIGATSQSGPASSTVNFAMRTETACNATSTVQFAISGDTTGGASVVGPNPVTTTLDTTFPFQVALGPNNTGTGQVIATCISADCAGDTVTFNYATFANFVYVQGTPTSTNAIQGAAFQMTTSLTVDGVAGTIPSIFNPGATTVPTNGAGDATRTTSQVFAGTYNYTAQLDCTAAPAGCSSVPAVPFSVVVEHPTLSSNPTPVNVFVGEVANLTVTYDGDTTGVPAPNGYAINWNVAPVTGTTLVGNNVAGGAGQATATFSATAAGTYTVNAFTGCTFCGGGQSTSITVVVVQRQLTLEQGDSQTGIVGTPYTDDLIVNATDFDGGSSDPISGVTINWTVTAGTATFGPTAPTDGGGDASVQVTPTSPGTIGIRATRADDPTVFVDFSLSATAAPASIVALNPVPADIDLNVPTAFRVEVTDTGTGAPIAGTTVAWTSGDPSLSLGSLTSVTNAAGRTIVNVTGSAVGNFPTGVTASIDPDGIPTSGDEDSVVFNVTVAAVPGLTLNGGNGQAGTVGTNYPAVLSVIADNSGAAAPGVTINWTVTGGSATITPSGPTDPTGEAHASVTPTAAGTITITAERADAPGVLQTFTLTATAAATTTTALSPLPTNINQNVATLFRVEVLDAGGAPIVGIPVNWTSGDPSLTVSSPTSTTNVNGRSSVNVTGSAVGTFPTGITASVDPDGVAGTGDESSASFNVNVAAVLALTINGGNGQTGTVGTPFPSVLSVIADNSGAAAPGVTINWTVTGGAATITPSGPTDGTGEAHASVTATAAGPITITAERGDAPGVLVTFSLTAVDPEILSAVTANPATGTIGTPMTFTVQLDQGAFPVAGATIQWSTLSPPFAATAIPNGTTNGSGQASVTLTPNTAGTFPSAVVALYDPDGIAGNGDEMDVQFTVTTTAAATTTTALSPLPTNISQNVPTLFRIEVLDAGGAPIVGIPVNWTTGDPSLTVSSPTSTTNVNGRSSVNVTGSVAGTFPTGVTASVDPDGIAGTGDESSASFNVNVATVPALTINGGNGQTGTVGSPFPSVLSVIADNSGAAAPGVTINWTVTGGAATITPSGPTDGTGEAHASVTATAAGPITITAERGDAPGVLVTFSLTAVDPKILSAVTPNPATGTTGTAMTFTVQLDQGAFPVAGATIQWSALSPPFPATAIPNGTTNGSGQASVTLTPNTAGTFPSAVVALYDPDGIAGNGDEMDVQFDVTVGVVRTLTLVAGDAQTTTSGTAFPVTLDVLAENSGTPVAGLLINWTLVSGSAVIDDVPVTTASGHSTAAITASAPGPIQIRAERSDDATVFVLFNLTATPAPFVLTTASGNPATGTVGTPIPVTVELNQGGAPVTGVGIHWSTTGPFTVSAPTTTTNGSGQATVNLTGTTAGTFTNALTATYDPDGILGNADDVSVSYDANIAFVAELAITGGDGQSALPGATFGTLLEVHASNSGVPAPGLGINWTATGGLTVSPFGPTDAGGDASATVVAGTATGPATVTATRADDPSVSVTFHLTVNAFGTLTIVGGDEQTLTAGVVSDPLEVELRDAGGTPIAGAVVNWSTTVGTLGGATSTTNAAGIATNTVTVTVAGTVEVTASSPLAGAPVTFALNGALGNLPGLDPLQEEVADAIDHLCPALASMATLTPEQSDLLARCEELIDAAAIDPAATVVAIDALMADVALAQGTASMLAAQAQFQNLKTRIAALRSGTVGASFGGLALNTPTGPISMDTLSSAFAAAEDPVAGPADGTEIGADFSRWGFFASGNIGRGEQDEGAIDPEFDYDIDGITLGVDYRYSDSWIFGAAWGYTRQDTELAGGRGGVDTSGWSLSAFTTYYKADSWYVDGVFTWGQNDFELMRRIEYTVPTPGGGTSTISQEARADTSGDMLSTAFTVGRDFNRGALGIGPYARLLYTRLNFDEINEQMLAGPGSGLGLQVEERELTSLASVLGTKLTYTYSTEWGVVIPHVQLEWEHEFHDDPQSLQAHFLHDPTATPIIVEGDRLDTDYVRLGLGLSMVLTKGRSGFLYYEHMFGRDGSSQYNLSLGLRLEF